MRRSASASFMTTAVRDASKSPLNLTLSRLFCDSDSSDKSTEPSPEARPSSSLTRRVPFTCQTGRGMWRHKSRRTWHTARCHHRDEPLVSRCFNWKGAPTLSFSAASLHSSSKMRLTFAPYVMEDTKWVCMRMPTNAQVQGSVTSCYIDGR